MEILECEKNGVSGWKCGEDGECYIGLEAKQKAFRMQKKIKAAEFKETPAELPKNLIDMAKEDEEVVEEIEEVCELRKVKKLKKKSK